jgi:tetratricopeptide (TPR) repeat protein
MKNQAENPQAKSMASRLVAYPLSLLPLLLLALGSVSPLPAADLQTARELYNSGDYAACSQEAALQLVSRPWMESWWRLQLRCQLEMGEYTQATETYLNASVRFTTSIQLRWLGYRAFRHTHEPVKANILLEEIERLVNQTPWRYSDAVNRVIVGRLFLLRGGDPRQVLELAYDRARRDSPNVIDSSIATAELALEKQDFTLALGSLAKAVEIEPDNPLVHYLLSRALIPTDTPKAAAALDKALELNPNHLPTRLFLAERLIDQEQYDPARRQLMQVLEVNPRHSQAWAYMAVIAHLENKVATEQAFHTIASQWSADDADVDYWIGLKLSQKYRFAEGARYQRRALEQNPRHTQARIQLSQDLLRLGQEQEGWQLADEVNRQDQYDIVAHNLVTLRDRLAGFRTLERDGFIVRMDRREATIYGERVLALLSRARQSLTEKYDSPLPESVYVEIFPDQRDFAIRTFGLPGGAGFLGVCFGSVITANSPASQGDQPSNWEAVLWHEFCHVVTLQKTNNKMPRWLSEGISVYEEKQENAGWGQSMSAAYREIILADGLTPVSQLSGAFLAPPSPLHLQFAYFESSLVVEYLVEHYGLDTLKRILMDLSVGMPINESLRRYTGSLELLDKEFEQFARARAEQLAPQLDFSDQELPEKPDAATWNRWQQAHPDNYLGLAAYAAWWMKQEEWEQAEKPLRRLLELFPEDIAPGNAYQLLSIVLGKRGEEQQQRQLLEAWIARDGEILPARLRLMEIYKQNEDWARVDQLVQSVLAINPLRADPHEQLLGAARARGEKVKTIQPLAALLEMSPVDPAALHYQLADALVADGQLKSARRQVLWALEYAPRYREAQRLLLKLNNESGQKPAGTGEKSSSQEK